LFVFRSSSLHLVDLIAQQKKKKKKHRIATSAALRLCLRVPYMYDPMHRAVIRKALSLRPRVARQPGTLMPARVRGAELPSASASAATGRRRDTMPGPKYSALAPYLLFLWDS
jgi:hypothetical protein